MNYKNAAKQLAIASSLCAMVAFGMLMSTKALAAAYSEKNLRQESMVFGRTPKKNKPQADAQAAPISIQNKGLMAEVSGHEGDPRKTVSPGAPAPQAQVQTQAPAQKPQGLAKKRTYWEQKGPTTGGPGLFSMDGWKLSSTGGIAYENPKDQRYWFKLSGVIRVDQVFFSGSYRDKRIDFPNSGFLRAVETYLDSGLGENWLSTVSLTYTGERIEFSDTWIGYTGFAKNNELNIGRHSGSWFGMENSSGTTWNPFMERSLQANVFYPGDGIGLLTDWWWEHSELTLMFTVPDHGTHIVGPAPNFTPQRSDRWRFVLRTTVAPVHELGDVWHFGFSYAHRRHDADLSGILASDFGLQVRPGLRGRNIPFLVNTGFLHANYAHQYNVEAARQWGPLILEAEYTEAFVHRVGALQGPVRFSGYNIQGRYMLTGQCHSYDVRDGTFGSVDIDSPYGAYELVARYDYVNLNDKDVRGGSEHNAWLGLNWFINQQVRFTINYVRANIRPRNNELTRRLDIYGVRLQVRFK